MKNVFKILIVFALIGDFTPFQELYEFAVNDSIQHNCCGNTSQEKENQNTCKPLCNCFSTLLLLNLSPASLSLDVIFTQNHSHTNKFAKEQTEPVFRPPIA